MVGNVADKVTFTGAGTAVVMGLTLNNIAALVGMAVAILGLLVSWYYKHKATRLLERSLQEAHRPQDIPEALEKFNEHID